MQIYRINIRDILTPFERRDIKLLYALKSESTKKGFYVSFRLSYNYFVYFPNC